MKVVDSHTAGEPTRVIIEGGPDLGTGSLADRLVRFNDSFDHLRKHVILEPRGSDALVGALLCEPVDKSCAAGVIFFNNAGYLGMCGHGLIGLAVTLHYLGLIELGQHSIETPVGKVSVDLRSANTVSIQNVPSYCYRKDVCVAVQGHGEIVGDIAWGGNWFFLAKTPSISIGLDNINQLTDMAERLKYALSANGITGKDAAEIDHVEFFDAPKHSDSDSRNFVLCPGGAYDRSPCGTGTSAKLACLAERDKLEPNVPWVQESVIGSSFTGQYSLLECGYILPTISGSAYICSESELIRQADDPFVDGIT